MSRIGKKPVPVPKGVTVTVDGRTVSAKGPKGQQAFTVNDFCNVALGDAGVTVEPVDKSREARAAWGLNRTMIANVVNGVANEFVRELELVGVGYRAALKGTSLNLALGYSHEIDFQAPEGIKIVVPKPTEIVISGIDRQAVGQTAAKIRSFRPPEPYKGKGVKYKGEFIFRKEGKKK